MCTNLGKQAQNTPPQLAQQMAQFGFRVQDLGFRVRVFVFNQLSPQNHLRHCSSLGLCFPDATIFGYPAALSLALEDDKASVKEGRKEGRKEGTEAKLETWGHFVAHRKHLTEFIQSSIF